MDENKRKVSEVNILQTPKSGKKLSLIIGEGAVTTYKIADKAITKEKLSDDIGPDIVAPVMEEIELIKNTQAGHTRMITEINGRVNNVESVINSVDYYPTEDSDNLVKSGGVFEMLQNFVESDTDAPNVISIVKAIDNISIVGDYEFPVLYAPEDYTAKLTAIEVFTNISTDYVTAEMNADNTAVILHVLSLPDEAFDMHITINARFKTGMGIVTRNGISDIIGLNYRYPQIVMEQRAEINDVGEYEYPFHLGPADYDAPISSITPSVNQPSDWVTVRIENSSVFVNVLKQREYDYPIVVSVDVAFNNGVHAQGSATTIVTPKYPTFTLTNDDVIAKAGDYDFALTQGEEEGVTAVIASIVPSILSNSETEPVPTVQMVTDSLLRMTVSQAPYNTIKVDVIATVTFTSGKVLPVTCTKDIIGEEGFITSESNPEVMKIISKYTDWSRSTEKITYTECLAVTDLGTIFSQAQAEHPYTPLIPIDPSTMTPQEIADAEAQNVIIEAHNAEESLYHVKHFEELGYFTGLTEIHADAFKGCDELTKVVVPNTIIAFRKDCFWGCSSLISMYTQYAIENYTSVTRESGAGIPIDMCLLNLGTRSNRLQIYSGAFAYTAFVNVLLSGEVINDANQTQFVTTTDWVSPFAYSKVEYIGPLEVKYNNYEGYYAGPRSSAFVTKNIFASVKDSITIKLYPQVMDNDDNFIIFANHKDFHVYPEDQTSNTTIGIYGKNVTSGAAMGMSIGYRLYIKGNVGVNAFKDADVRYINMTSGCHEIGDYAFSNCKNVEFITCTANNAPTIYEHTFENCGIEFEGDKHLNILQGASGFDTGYWADVQSTLGYEVQYPVLTSISNNVVFNMLSHSGYFNSEAFFADDGRIAIIGTGNVKFYLSGTFTEFSFDEFRYFTGITVLATFGFNNDSTIDRTLTSIIFPPSITQFGLMDSDEFMSQPYYGRVYAQLDSLTLDNVTLKSSYFYNSNYVKFDTLTVKNNIICSGDIMVYTDKLILPDPEHSEARYGNAFTNVTGYINEIYAPQITLVPTSMCRDIGTLTKFEAPNVTKVGNYSFTNCGTLSQFDFSNITSIGEKAFANSRISGIEGVLDLSSVTQIGNRAFETCPSLFNCRIVLNNALTAIPYRCFYSCRIGSINIPTSLETVGESAFYFCDKLSTLDFSQSQLNSIGKGAFERMSSLRSILLPSRTITIDILNTFKDDVLLADIDFRNAILVNSGYSPSLDDTGTFTGCTALRTVKMVFQNLTYPSFNECTALYSVDITAINSGSVASVLYKGFHNCDALTAITLKAATIYNYAFDDCTLLESVVLESAYALKDYVFRNCVNLANFTCYATNPPQLGIRCFENMGISVTGPKYLTIPASAEAAYRASSDWMYLVDTLGYTLQTV